MSERAGALMQGLSLRPAAIVIEPLSYRDGKNRSDLAVPFHSPSSHIVDHAETSPTNSTERCYTDLDASNAAAVEAPVALLRDAPQPLSMISPHPEWIEISLWVPRAWRSRPFRRTNVGLPRVDLVEGPGELRSAVRLCHEDGSTCASRRRHHGRFDPELAPDCLTRSAAQSTVRPTKWCATSRPADPQRISIPLGCARSSTAAGAVSEKVRPVLDAAAVLGREGRCSSGSSNGRRSA